MESSYVGLGQAKQAGRLSKPIVEDKKQEQIITSQANIILINGSGV